MLSSLKKDTGFNVGTNDIPCHVKINADEFTLRKEEKWFYVSVHFFINSHTA